MFINLRVPHKQWISWPARLLSTSKLRSCTMELHKSHKYLPCYQADLWVSLRSCHWHHSLVTLHFWMLWYHLHQHPQVLLHQTIFSCQSYLLLSLLQRVCTGNLAQNILERTRALLWDVCINQIPTQSLSSLQVRCLRLHNQQKWRRGRKKALLQ